jgi:clan AA aspartic protease
VAIEGSITDDGLEPEVQVTLVSKADAFDAPEVRAVVDTGFTGELTLPEELIRELGYLYVGSADGTLADGSESLMHFYEGAVLWHGSQGREITVVAADSQPLIGMEILSGSQLTVEATPGGAVRIDQLP